MSKEKVTEEKVTDKEKKEAEELKEEVEDTSFEYGDLVVICGKCGKEQVIDTNIAKGIQLNILTNHKYMLELKCDGCDSHMILKFKESKNPPKEEEVNENVPEESKEG